MTRMMILLVATALLGGCKDKQDGGGSAAKAAEAKASPTKLPKLGLSIDVPGTVEVGDAIMGEGHMLMGAGVGALTIEIAPQAQTIEEAKTDAELYTPKNLKEEKLADGWAVTFENTGSMGKNHFVQVQRAIGGKTYKCSTTVPNATQATSALAACKTLRP